MKIGFTGTRSGMTKAQKQTFIKILREHLEFKELHHGDCTGADDEAATLAWEITSAVEDGKGIDIHCHPPIMEAGRAYNPYSTVTYTAKTHFARNREIVHACDLLIATPYQKEHQTHGGTWYTIDYAKKLGKPVWVIEPDGTVRAE